MAECFWTEKVGVREVCDAGPDPGGDWQPLFGHNIVTSSPNMYLYRDYVCDPELYDVIAAAGTDMVFTHFELRGGASSEFQWVCGDGPIEQPNWIALGEPLFMNYGLDGSDVYWWIPWESMVSYVDEETYGYINVRIEMTPSGESPVIIEGVLFISPGF